MSHVFLFSIFFFTAARSFSPWWPLALLIFSPPLQNFHVFLPTKKFYRLLFSLTLALCRSLSRWASLACRLLYFYLCLYTDTETISAFRFLLCWLFSRLCFTRHGETRVAMRFPAKITSRCIWVAIPVGWVILHWSACGADGRRAGRRAYGHVITKISRMGRWPNFLRYGAPLLQLLLYEEKLSFSTKKFINRNNLMYNNACLQKICNAKVHSVRNVKLLHEPTINTAA